MFKFGSLKMDNVYQAWEIIQKSHKNINRNFVPVIYFIKISSLNGNDSK